MMLALSVMPLSKVLRRLGPASGVDAPPAANVGPPDSFRNGGEGLVDTRALVPTRSSSTRRLLAGVMVSDVRRAPVLSTPAPAGNAARRSLSTLPMAAWPCLNISRRSLPEGGLARAWCRPPTAWRRAVPLPLPLSGEFAGELGSVRMPRMLGKLASSNVCRDWRGPDFSVCLTIHGCLRTCVVHKRYHDGGVSERCADGDLEE